MEKVYDLIIIGGSAAGASAGIYAARRGLDFKILAKDLGGEVATSGEVGNFPGWGMTDGLSISSKFKEHLDMYKADIEEGVEIGKIVKQEDGIFCIATKQDGTKMASSKIPEDGNDALKCDYRTKAVILATGVHPRELDVPGEKEFRNKGVSYCSTCDMPLFGGKTIVVIGGGNSALESGLMAADIAKKGYVINKNPKFKGENVLIEKLSSKDNIEVIYEAKTLKIIGNKFVEKLVYADREGKEHEIVTDGIFVHIGQLPNSWMAPEGVAKDAYGQIIVNAKCETNIPGFYAAGDVTDVPFKQIVIASSQGSIAALSAVEYLNRLK
jgi:thioredoxin reductase